ncbi:MAG: TlpA disulfide reductase family protein [Bacteroidia bacterium]|nr:TlpA disulfide reductase family protein [Bacteroidia bacterium]
MKANILYGIAALALASCQNSDYTITMELPNMADSTMVLLKGYESNVTTDTAFVMNGIATFNGSINGSQVRRIIINNSRLYANVILEPGNIKANFITACGEGTPLNEKLVEYKQWSDDLNEVVNTKYNAFMSDSTLSSDEKDAKYDLLIEDFNKSIMTYTDSVVALNKNNAFGQFAFWSSYLNMLEDNGSNYETYKAALDKAGSYIASFERIQEGTKQKESYNNTKPGTKFVDFTIENGNLDGSVAKFSDYIGNGKVVLVDFWASWCGPCRRAIPMVKAVYDKYKGDKFDVLGVAVWDKRDKSLKAIEEEDMTWNLIIDANSIPTDIYGIYGIPELILFDADGTIISRSFSPKELDSIVAEALNK